ncbi:ABC transporter permease subunit [Paenibacillus doosanensis]|uniref:ABC-2 family transporter protein n=1 Tax=Paenibacillus konkukensis TaxID=2020716 RepID=A0ABY4RT42_9BACL|nr:MULTISPECIES: ABC transporter permease subunit [Paenibacillus]MCS7463780.1 ABC transporter permease subunit [Paenibacillus doosanensis]UQZ85278.1 ABC-2 family transporter protein [Paenibacillus konkukensis]
MMTIIGMTWKELLRKRVMLLTLLMTLVFLVAFWFVAQTIGARLVTYPRDKQSIEYLVESFTMGTITLTLGFFFGSFVIAFLSIFGSFSVISGEAEQGVLQALLPRPLPRWHWYMGRWVGYVSLGVGYAALLFISILVITQIHSRIPSDPLSLIKSFLLFAWVVPLLVSVSMAGSCLFSALGNGVFMTMLYGAGWLGGMIEKIGGVAQLRDESLKPLMTIAGLMSLLMPSESLQHRMISELFSFKDMEELVKLNAGDLGPFGVGQIPSNAYLVYAGCYTIIAMIAGMLLFRRKDL